MDARPTADQLELLNKALADRFRVERVLGQGGSATVYLAKDLELDRDVAIKVLRPEIAESVGAERFAREIRVTAHLQHPNIVPITESGAAGGFVYCVLPYIDGESLRDLLKRSPQLEVAEAVRLARDIAAGLAYAHSEGFLHRDIKPANILLSSGHAVIADFGLTKAIVGSVEGELSTETGIAVGTPQYMSPEQASASKAIDARTDQYSLACVVYEMLAGEPPFSGPTPQAVSLRHMHQAPPSIRIVRPGVSQALEGVLERALAKVPADRYASITEFSNALAEAVDAPTPPAPLFGWPRQRVAVALAVLVVAVLGWTALNMSDRLGGARATPPAGGAIDPPRVAVLNFDATAPGVSAFAATLTNRLTDALGATDPTVFTVAPRSAIAPYERRGAPLRNITQDLRIATMVSGSVESLSGEMRIDGRLIDAKTENVLNTIHVTALRPDRPALVNAVADTVLTLLNKMLGPEIKKRWQALGTTSAEAFDLVQDAEDRRASFDSALSAGGVAGAQRTLDSVDALFAAAEHTDRRWSEPIIGRGKLWSQRVQLVMATTKSFETRMQVLHAALNHAERAVKLTPDDPQALQLRGSIRSQIWMNDRPLDERRADALRDSAKADLVRALEGNPNRSRVLLMLSDIFAKDGEFDVALKYATQAYKSDPFLANPDQTVRKLFEYSYELGQDSAAARWCAEGTARFSDQAYNYECQLQLLARTSLSRADPALARRLKDSTLARYDSVMRGSYEPLLDLFVGMVYAKAKQRDSARAVINRARAIKPLLIGRFIALVETLTLLGENDEAAKSVVSFVAEYPETRDRLRSSRSLSAIRNDSRVQKALAVPTR